MSLATTSPMELATLIGISESKARKLIKEARNGLQLSFQKAVDFAKKRGSIKKIGTGCKAFDDMLDGGFEARTLTEVYGKTASGKSQLSHLMCVRALLEDKNAKSIYIDSESTFREDRIKDMAIANGLKPEDALNRIYVARAFNVDHQILLIEEIEKMLQEDNNYKLLVIDSLTSHFRSEYIGMGMLARRQQSLNKHLHLLLKLADIYNIVIILTNQIQSDPSVFYGNPDKPIGGNILSHSVTSIISLRPAKASTWVAKLEDSPNLPKNDCSYLITKNGFEDVK